MNSDLLRGRIDVNPPLSKPLILVVDGIALSIILWKFIAYFNYSSVGKSMNHSVAFLNPTMALISEMKRVGL